METACDPRRMSGFERCNGLFRIVFGIAAIVFMAGSLRPLQAREPINIEKWPDDVPYDALKKNADGSYEMTVPWARFYTMHTGGK